MEAIVKSRCVCSVVWLFLALLSMRYALHHLYKSAAIATTNDAHSDEIPILVAAPGNTEVEGDGALVTALSAVGYPGPVAVAFHPAPPPIV
jgi:hypothetical protein